MMDEQNQNPGWNFFENIYKNSIQSGKTFSDDMIDVIKEEFEKMYKQYQEYIKNNVTPKEKE